MALLLTPSEPATLEVDVSALRLADLLAGLSRVTDLGFGMPLEHSVRSCVIATGLATKMGLEDDQVSDTYYTALLEHLGCIAYAHESALAFGDELVMAAAGSRANPVDRRDILTTFLGGVVQGRPILERGRIVAFTFAKGSRFIKDASLAICEVARRAAERLGLSPGVRRSLYEVFEWWNGQGGPQGLKADQIAPAGRISRVASFAALFDEAGGTAAACDAVRRRTASLLDPDIVEIFANNATELLERSRSGDPRQIILELEPAPVIHKSETELVEVSTVFADLADLKTPFTHGHSRGVATLACAAGVRLGLLGPELRSLELGALLHDLGRVGVSNEIWQKPGPLTSGEWEQVRLHAYQTERILAGSSALAPIARLAGMHHERLDGSGYHRGCKAEEQPLVARVLATADAYHAMTQSRPHRAALTTPQARDQLNKESTSGRMDPAAVAAVLEAGDRPGSSTPPYSSPAGLSPRELEVVALVARGLSNKDVAGRLRISRRTAEHHVQHIYAKLGISSRPALALFAVEHHLLEPHSWDVE